MHPHQQAERTFYHFSFLRDAKVYGIYYNSIIDYINLYPFIKKNHSHDFYTLLLITKGNGKIKINDIEYTLQPQTMCLIASAQLHSFENIGDAEGILFFFCQDFYVEEFSFIRLLNLFSYTSQVRQNGCSPCLHLSESEYSSIYSLFNSVHQEYKTLSSNNSSVIIRSLLNIILLKLSDWFETKSGTANKSDSILIHTLSHLVDSYYIQEQQIGFYMSALNISETQLNDICNKHFDCGLKKILQNRLMQEARRLLLSSELSVAEIAYKLNFEDDSYFNKVFKNQIGLTPKNFRDMHKRLV